MGPKHAPRAGPSRRGCSSGRRGQCLDQQPAPPGFGRPLVPDRVRRKRARPRKACLGHGTSQKIAAPAAAMVRPHGQFIARSMKRRRPNTKAHHGFRSLIFSAQSCSIIPKLLPEGAMVRVIALIALVAVASSVAGCSRWPFNGEPMPVL